MHVGCFAIFEKEKSHKSTQKTKIHRKIFARFGYYAYLCSVHSRQPLNFKLSGVFVYSDMVKDNKQFNTYKEGLDLEFLREYCMEHGHRDRCPGRECNGA